MFGVIIACYQYVLAFSSYDFERALPSPPKNAVSITFDDGPHPKYTPEILNILKEKKVHATFFIIGSHVPKRENILKREMREGHEIGNHSFSHLMFTKISREKIFTEVFFTNLEILKSVGKYPKYFRFPYGAEAYDIIHSHSGPIIGWNVDAYDWKAKDPKKLAENIIKQTKDGSIILLHDIKEDTVKALPFIIDGLRKKGYHMVPLDILLSKKIQPKKGVVYRGRYTQTALKKKMEKSDTKLPTSENIIPAKDPVIVTDIPLW